MEIKNITENHICTGCGTCSGICPTGAIKMEETLDGRLEPYILKSTCTDCHMCSAVCPQLQVSDRMKEILKSSIIGPVCSSFLGKPTDYTLFMEGQTCGFVRSLLMYAIESGYADKILCVRDDENNPLRPVVDAFSEISQIRNVSRSKYCPIKFGQVIKHIRKVNATYVVVGTGCQIQGLNLVLEKLPLLKKRVKLTIGLFCDRILKYGAADFLVRRTGIKLQNIKSFDYRHKQWRGWPGDVRMVDNEFKVYQLDRKWRLRILEFYTPVSCRLCGDKFNMLSDIAVGDPWGAESGKDVSASVIARTITGKNFLLQACQDGTIKLNNSETRDISRGQNSELRIKNCIEYKSIMEELGLRIPALLQCDLFNQKQIKAGFLNRVNMKLSLFFETKKGAEFLHNLPLWLPFAMVFLKKIILFSPRMHSLLERKIRRFIT